MPEFKALFCTRKLYEYSPRAGAAPVTYVPKRLIQISDWNWRKKKFPCKTQMEHLDFCMSISGIHPTWLITPLFQSRSST